MNDFESYSFLLTDTICGNILLYAHAEYIIHVMKSLGGYDNNRIFGITTFGFAIAVMFNYLSGLVLHKIYMASTDTKQQTNYQTCQNFFQKYGIYILCTNIFPFFGAFLTLLAGFVRFGWPKTLIISVITKLIYYAYYIYL